MVCKRSHAVAFHLTNPVGGIALEIVKEVKESCRGLAWVGRIWILPWKFDLWNSLKGLTVYEPSKASQSMSRRCFLHGLQLGLVMEVSGWWCGGGSTVSLRTMVTLYHS